MNAKGMYMRPGNLFKEFEILSVDNVLKNGTPVEKTVYMGKLLKGCLEAASPDDKLRWDQPQHPVTHSIVQTGSPQAKAGWVLQRDGKTYRINGVDPCGDLGVATIYYVEERGDTGV